MSPAVRAASWVLWALVALGPVLALAALLRQAPAPADDAEAPPAGVAGVAELAVVAHLRTTDPVGGLVPAHPGLRLADDPRDGLPTGALAADAQARATPVEASAAVDVRPAGPDRWGVTVGVLRAERYEAWQVTVAADDGTPQVETVPALVTTPPAVPAATPATSPLRPPDPDDPVGTAVERFLAAYLAGEGELGRYTAPDAALSAPPDGADDVRLTRLATGPVDERRVAALAEVVATRSDGAVHAMQYPLLLQREEGRWEVQRLLPGLPVRRPPTDEREDLP